MSLLRSHRFLFATLMLIMSVSVFVLSGFSYTNAAANPQMNYQGKLTDSSNMAVPDGTYNMRFWLLTSPSIATTSAIWTEELTGSNRVQVTNGLFSVMLGSTSPLTSVDFNQTLYLGVEIGSTTGSALWDGEMSPRKILGTVPAAFVADTLDGVNSTQFVRTDATSSISASTADTLLSVTQNGAGDILNLFDGGVEVFSVVDGGNIGVGTTSPSRKFTVQGGDSYFGGNVTGTGTLTISGLTTLADVTAVNATTSAATTTYLFASLFNATNALITNATSTTFRTGTLGVGSDYITDITGSGLSIVNGALTASGDGASNWLYNGSRLSPSTTVGIGVFASSTIGGGTGATGLSILGNATTTGSLIVQGATSTFASGIQLTGGCFRDASATSTCIGKGQSATYVVAASNSKNKQYADYAATGTNDQVVINAAIDAAFNASRGNGGIGGKVYLLEGDYSVNGSIVMNTGTMLFGSGNGTVIRLADAVNTTTYIVFGSGVSNVTVADMLIDGNKTNNTGTQRGVYFTGVSSSTIRNITATATNETGILLSGSSNNILTGNTLNSHGSYGIYLAAASTNNIISNNTANNNGLRGIYISSSSNNTVTGNVTNKNSHTGIYATGGSNFTTITNNIANEHPFYGIQVAGLNGVVTGNITSMNATHGIYLFGGAVITVSGNTAYNNGQYGIYVWNTSYNTVTGNTFYANAQSGIALTSANNNTVTANSLYANGNSGVYPSIYVTGSSDNTISSNNITATSTDALLYIDSTSLRNYVVGNSYSNSDTNVFVLDYATSSTRYTQFDRLTLDTRGIGEVTNSLFSISGSSSVALASSTQWGSGKLFSWNTATSGEVLTLSNAGRLGIGSSTPSRILTVAGDAIFANTWATGTASSTYASTSALTLFQRLYDTNQSAGTSGQVLTSTGTSTIWTTLATGGSSNWLYNGSRLSPSTTVGIGVFASSTIGGGTGATGLTISGGATTTGNAYFAGNVGIGTNNPSRSLHVVYTGGTPYESALFQSSCDTCTAGINVMNGSVQSTGDVSAARFSIGDPANTYAIIGAAAEDSGGNGTIIFAPAQTGTAVTRMIINSAGNTSIGTTSANNRLTVWGIDTASTTRVFDVVNSASTTLLSVFGDGRTSMVTASSTYASTSALTLFQRLFDTNQSAGSSGQVLTSTGTSTLWTTLALSGGGSHWLYNGSRLSPSTTVGIGVFASSTIGGGTGATGLSILGNATTTGSLIVQGSATSTFAAGIQLSGGCFRDASATSTCIGKGQAATYVVAASNSKNKQYADYIADGTGDQNEINHAIQAAYTTSRGMGGKVYLLEGDYSVNGTTTMATGTMLIGSGNGTVIKLADNTNATAPLIAASAVSYITIADFVLDGNRYNNTGTQYGVYFSNVSTSTIRNITASGTNDYSIYLSESHHNNITNNTAINSNSIAGIRLNLSTHNVISGNNSSRHPSGYGIYLTSFSYFNTITGNITNNNVYTGIYVTGGSSYGTVGGNTSNNNSLDGIYAGVVGATIIGNTTNNNSRRGIYLACAACTVSGNSINKNAQSGISISGGAVSNTISGNSFYGNGSSGVYASIYVAANNNTISSNLIYATSTDPLIELAVTSANNYIVGNSYFNADTSTYISDAGIDNRYSEWDRLTLDTKTIGEVGYSLFSISGSSSVALASSTQWGSGKLFSWNTATSGEVMTLANSGYLGLGSSTPSRKLTVAGDALFANTWATGTASSTYASTSRLTLHGALFDAQNSSGTNGQILQTTGSGVSWVSTSTLGLGMSNWLYNGSRLSPSTTVGIGVFASSTIGGGTGATGLTILGNATTTGSLIVQGSATSTFANGIQLSGGCFRDTSATSTCIGKGRDGTYIVAAPNSTNKAHADYVADNAVGAEHAINHALQAAYASGRGGKVYLLEGDFILSTGAGNKVLMATSTSLIGAGKSTVIHIASSTNANAYAIAAYGTHNMSIQHLTLNGNTANNSGWQTGIWMEGVSTSTVVGVEVSSFSDNGIYLWGGNGNRFENNNIIGNGGYGLSIYYAGISTPRNDTVITNNVVRDNLFSGILWETNGETGLIANNVFRGNAIGVEVVSGRVSIIGNDIIENSEHGVAAGSSNSIVNNRIHNNGGSGAYSGIYHYGLNTLIANNVITDTDGTGYAIDLDGAEDMVLVGNQYSGTGASSIRDAGINTRYTGYDRLTLDTRGLGQTAYSLFSISGSSSVALASSTQWGSGKLFSWNTATSGEVMTLANSGYLGLGSSTPSRKLTVSGDAIFANTWATGTASSTYASTSALTLFQRLFDTNQSAGSSGQVLTSTGTSTLWTTLALSGGGSHWLYNGSRLSPSTTVGIGVFASSTIGGGTGATGLTISGGATTTGNMYLGGTLGIATTTPSALLSVLGSGTGNLFAFASSTGSNMLSLDTRGVLTFGTTTNASIFINGGGTTTQLSRSQRNIAIGSNAMSYYTSSATDNIGIGFEALYGSSSAPMSGINNFAVGSRALRLNTVGSYNVAIGNGSLDVNSTGSGNNAIGEGALGSNTDGSNNNALGYSALNANITGSSNNSLGYLSLTTNTTGSNNNALGSVALFSNTIGSHNIAIGSNALRLNTSGSNVTALGYRSGYSHLRGTSTLYLGTLTDTLNADVSSSTALGVGALLTLSNTMVLGGTGLNAVDIVSGTSTPWAKFSLMNNYGSTTALFDIATTTSASYATSSLFRVGHDGKVGIGSSTPSRLLTVAGDALFANTWATGTASSTYASTSRLTLHGQLYDTNGTAGSSGQVLTSTGTSTLWTTFTATGDGGSHWLYNGSRLSPSTTVGIGVFASSTIGGGTGATGLTISGGATTTGNMYLGGTLGIATTTPSALLSVLGSGTGNLFAFASSTGSNMLSLDRRGRLVFGTTTEASIFINGGGTTTETHAPGMRNVAIGNEALSYYVAGASGAIENIALGYRALYGVESDRMTGDSNIALGSLALSQNTSGTENIALGGTALLNNSTGSYNNSFGIGTLLFNTSGSYNNAFGYYTLYANTSGVDNSAFGSNALFNNDEGSGNAAFGNAAGSSNTSGNNNLFIGDQADSLHGIHSNLTAIGSHAKASSSNSMVLGGTGLWNVNIITGSSTPYAKFSIQNNYGSTTALFDIATTTSASYATSSLFRVGHDGRVSIGSTTPEGLFTMQATNATGSVIAGMKQYFSFANSTASAIYYGDNSYIVNAPNATSTLVGKIIRIEDSTALGNTVRGLEVQAQRGTNTKGENTGISGFGRTFGVRGSSEGDAGDTFVPAGVFAELRGTTQGNALRAYSGTITTSNLVQLFHDSSVFSGTGLLMNFGNSGGSFAPTSSAKFIDLKIGGTSKFTVTAGGTTTIGDGTTANMAGLQIGYGGICVDNDGSCTATTSGKITAVSYGTANSDLAEMYFSDDDLMTGEIVSLRGGLSIDRAVEGGDMPILGVVSTKPGLVMGSDDSSLYQGETGYPIGLKGRVPVRLSTENGPIVKGDRITLSSIPGVGMKALESDMTVGIALEDYEGDVAYSDGFVNQFADDLVKARMKPRSVDTDIRAQDGCSFGGGGAQGEKPCVKDAVTPIKVETIDVDEKTRIVAELRAEDPEIMEIGDGREVAIGQAIMFIDLDYHFAQKETDFLKEILSTTTVTDGNGEETLWDRIKSLAQNFVDGVLRVAGVKTDELCVGEVCVDEEQFLRMVQRANVVDSSPDDEDDTEDTEESGEEDEVPLPVGEGEEDPEPEPQPTEDEGAEEEEEVIDDGVGEEEVTGDEETPSEPVSSPDTEEENLDSNGASEEGSQPESQPEPDTGGGDGVVTP